MKLFKFYCGALLTLIVAFCVSIYFTMCSSVWFIFIISDLVLCFGIIKMIKLTIKWCNTMNEKECVTASKKLDVSMLIFLIAGFANALFSLNQTYSFVRTTIGLFCFICFILSLFFSSFIKHRNQKDDGN